MLEQFFAYVVIAVCLILMMAIMGFVALFYIYCEHPEIWERIKNLAKTSSHKHRLGPWEWLEGIPSINGGSTGFAVALCMDEACACAAVMPRVNLMKNASPEFREEFLQGLTKIGRRLID